MNDRKHYLLVLSIFTDLPIYICVMQTVLCEMQFLKEKHTPKDSSSKYKNTFLYLVKSVISIMIIHICLALTIISLPLSSHLATSISSLAFSIRNISNCAWIFSFSSWGRALIIARSDLPWISSWSVCQLAA